MRRSIMLVSVISGVISLATLGCGTTKPPPAPQAPQEPTAPPPPSAAPAAVAPPAKESAPATGPAAVPAAKTAPKTPMGTASAEPAKPAAAPPVPVVAKESAPAPVAAPSKPPATPPAAATPVEPSKGPETPAASPHAKLGAEKCMMCHKVQYASWNQSKHKAKGLDCEGCHGNGADYKSISVMKDRAAAVKAGLILPGLAFCKKCHVKGDASLLPLVHAHKAK